MIAAPPEPDIVPGSDSDSDSQAPALPATRVNAGLDRRIAVRAALLAGLLGLLTTTVIPLLGIVLTGALAIFFYRFFGGESLLMALAARLGAAAWTVSFAIFCFFYVTSVVFARSQVEEQMIKRVQALGGDMPLAQVQEAVRFVLSPVGLSLTLLVYFGIGVALAAIGGAVAASLGRGRA